MSQPTSDQTTVDLHAAPAEPPIKKIEPRARTNPRWSTHWNAKLLTLPVKPLMGPDDTVFTIGSCFAERIRISLGNQGLKVGPPMEGVKMAPDRYRIDSLPKRPHMNYYNSFTIRQEFERHIGEWTQAEDDFWTLPKDPFWGGEVCYQDPYRRAVFGRTPEDLRDAVRQIDAAVDLGIAQSSMFFITLGMAEVFRNVTTGKIACQKPNYAGGAGEAETEFHMSSYGENYENCARIVEMIASVNPNARVVMSVSPVPLSRTFSDQDIITANTEGKSQLRAVLGAISRDFDQVTYFPSYEIVMANAPHSFRQDDGRHIANWIVDRIMGTFKEAHFDPNYAAVRTAAE